MTTSTPPAPTRRRPAPRPVQVVRTERIAPSFQRVTFGGPALEGFELTSPTGHIKVFLPGDGETEPALPTWGPDGPVFPEGRAPAVVRTYTPRRFDAERLELDVEFFLHGTGPASEWAAQAAPGDRAAIAGQGRGYAPDPDAEWFVYAGDDTAIPAIGMLLEATPPTTPTYVVIEVGAAEHEQPLPRHPQVSTLWVHRGDAPHGQALETAVHDLHVQPGNGRVWVAAEAGTVRRIRRHLLQDRHLPASSLVTRGYWREGVANHPDHDYGDD